MKKFLRRYLSLIFTLIGAAGGFLYNYFAGCASGSCPISSSPVLMTVYGAVLGYLIGSLFAPSEKKAEDTE